MNPLGDPAVRRRLRAVAALAAAYVALMGLLAWQPALLPRAAAPVLERAAAALGPLRLDTRVEPGGSVQLKAETHRLAALQTRTERGVALAYDATLDGRIVNRYLLLALALLLAWPGLPWRARLLALPPAAALVVACSVFDLYVQAAWQEMQMLNRAVASMQIPDVPSNRQLAADLAAYASRLQATKQFLSGGGRPFLAVVSFLVAAGLGRRGARVKPEPPHNA